MYTKLRIGNKCNKRSPITAKHAIKKILSHTLYDFIIICLWLKFYE